MKSSAPFWFLLLCGWVPASIFNSSAAETNSAPRFNIQGYLVNDSTLLLSTNIVPMLSPHTGTNVGLDEIVRAASDLQAEYAKRGYPAAGIAVGEGEITNGIVMMHIFQSVVPQIRISGKRYICSSNEVTLASNLMGGETTTSQITPSATNVTLTGASASRASSSKSTTSKPAKPPTPEEEALHAKMAELDTLEREANTIPQPPPTTQLILAPTKFTGTNSPQLALRHKLDELDIQEKRAQMFSETNSTASTTNSATPAAKSPTFEVKGYELIGNTLLSSNLVELIFQPYISNNMTLDRLRGALVDLQTVYRERGFATVSVSLPQQTLSDKIVKVRVFEGRLSEITIVNNHYFSSNNVMRALPGLHPNMILTAPVFQAELDRANANQDRQIYPTIEPGLTEGTTALELQVKDRFPLHAKAELNNQNSPGTPDLRMNFSAAYNDLWQLEHSLGVQYSFSPEAYKSGKPFAFYDQPLVANYGGFYRMPLGSPAAVEQIVAADSVNFGYDEATRKFNLPAPSGQPELNLYASHSTIDTGLEDTVQGKSL